ncbi:UNVERIFIED_ORG: hypothetical protein J2W38_006261 [Variovorax paradoxus]|nr:hypothetical protein [Variovorax paradoxus]
MPDDKKTLGQVLSMSSSSSFSPPAFNGNGTLGRVLTFEVPKGPMLRRKPGICSERYEREKAEFEKIPWYERMWIGTGRDARLEPTDALQSAKTFQRACEQMPDEIPKSALDDKLQQLNDHYSGKNPLPPEQSLELKRRTSFLQDVYTPGPRWEASTSGAESAWLSEQNLRFGNSLGIALLGPIFGAPGAATRVLGGSEQQVAAANQVGAAAFDMAAAHVGLGGKKPAPEPLPRPGESMRGAPLEPVSQTAQKQPTRGFTEPKLAEDGTVVVRRLPPGMKATDNKSIREWYNKHTSAERMKELDDKWKAEGKTPEERARLAFEERHNARLTARSYMLDPAEVEGLRQRDLLKYGSPDGPTFQQEVQKYGAQGLKGDDAYQAIIDGASRTSAEYNAKFGIKK